MSRPELSAPPEVYYNEIESKKYTTSGRVQHIQAEMTLRALDLLNVPPSSHILDIGCGSGLSGEILTQEGHVWIGMDISPAMLANALDREVEGDLFLADIGQGVPFRAGSFDAAISISAIQWLCNADKSINNPKTRLMAFFSTLYSSLKRGGKAVCQFYPLNEQQIEIIMLAAKNAGFDGRLIIDKAHSIKNKKYYLALAVGQPNEPFNFDGVDLETKSKKARKKSKAQETAIEYVNRKKDLWRKRGKKVASDSKYSARKRRPRF